MSQGDIFISNSFTNITLRTFFQSSCMARNICLGNYSLSNWARPIGAALEKETAWHSSCMSNIFKLWCNIRTIVHRNGYTEKHHQYHQHTLKKKFISILQTTSIFMHYITSIYIYEKVRYRFIKKIFEAIISFGQVYHIMYHKYI